MGQALTGCCHGNPHEEHPLTRKKTVRTEAGDYQLKLKISVPFHSSQLDREFHADVLQLCQISVSTSRAQKKWACSTLADLSPLLFSLSQPTSHGYLLSLQFHFLMCHLFLNHTAELLPPLLQWKFSLRVTKAGAKYKGCFLGLGFQDVLISLDAVMTPSTLKHTLVFPGPSTFHPISLNISSQYSQPPPLTDSCMLAILVSGFPSFSLSRSFWVIHFLGLCHYLFCGLKSLSSSELSPDP